MSREVYPALSGASAAWRQIEVVANNLANSNTDGFKEQRLAFEAAGSPDLARLSDSYVGDPIVENDLSDGPLRMDAVSTHLALRGRGFFVVVDDTGEESLVRSGRFSLDADRRLVTESGAQVLSDAGPVEVPEDEELVVAADGRISTSKGTDLGRLEIVDADNPVPRGATAWSAEGETWPAEGVEVLQGALEGSNVVPIRGMTDLIEASRYFEVYQKAMQSTDELDGRLNEMAR